MNCLNRLMNLSENIYPNNTRGVGGMNKPQEALKVSIKALELINEHAFRCGIAQDAIKACKAALSEPEQDSEREIAELKELLKDRQTDLDFEFNRAERNECEVNALKEHINDLREALEDMLSGWKYIRETHGDLYGVGWDRAQNKADQALSKTPAQSLQSFENEVIEMCAIVCDELSHREDDMGAIIAKQIRALKC